MDIPIVCNMNIYIYIIHIDILSVACFTLRSWLAKAKFFEMRSQGVPEKLGAAMPSIEQGSRGC